ncbi:hypothetical protein RI820_000704 [Pluralibacter gergoviae]|nr:hypothetical protein [Pluralibacter gergoviae]ELC3015857.1 hypothetical protein [Pluralibacter gergoviae]ELC3020836.1 hypothetical protein [Pluralibacter gergoviae]
MAQENKGGVSVYISPDIVAALNARQEKVAEALAQAGFGSLPLPDYTTGWLVRMHLRAALGMNQTHGGE